MTLLAGPVKETFYSIWPAFFQCIPWVTSSIQGPNKGDTSGSHNFRELLSPKKSLTVFPWSPQESGNIVPRHEFMRMALKCYLRTLGVRLKSLERSALDGC